MKGENRKLKNFTDEELLKEVANRKLQNKNGFPDPISAQCFKCKNKFWIKFVVPQKDYSKKNNWNYWCEEADKNLKICKTLKRIIWQFIII